MTVDISVWPDFEAASDRMAAVRFDLSQQPPDMAQGALFYVLGGPDDAELRKLEGPHRKFVRLDFQPRQWNHFTLHLTEDARRLELGGDDNSLADASFGVLSSGPRAHAFFDDYRIAHKIQSEALRAEARRMAAALQKEFGTINYVSQELSYQAHLNPFGEHVPMIDYVKHPAGLDPKATVDFVHANGGVCSLNHIFGTTRAPRGVDVDDPESARKFEEKRMQDLIASRCFGVDILEVGYPVRVLPMTSFLRVWDGLAMRASTWWPTASAIPTRQTAAGLPAITSSPGSGRGRNRSPTWWTAAPRRGVLRRSGEVQGRAAVDHGGRPPMGQVVVGGKASHRVNISIGAIAGGRKGADRELGPLRRRLHSGRRHVRPVGAGGYGEDRLLPRGGLYRGRPAAGVQQSDLLCPCGECGDQSVQAHGLPVGRPGSRQSPCGR